MRKIDADAFGRFLADWQLNLRTANECGGCEAELLGQVMKALDEQPTVLCDSSAEWISVEKYLPETVPFAGYRLSRPVWVCISLHTGKKFVTQARLYDGKWRLPTFCKSDDIVTHWMPINTPTLPVEEKNNDQIDHQRPGSSPV